MKFVKLQKKKTSAQMHFQDALLTGKRASVSSNNEELERQQL